MRKKLLALNLTLVVLLGATGWRIWQVRERARARQEAVLSGEASPVPVAPMPPVEQPRALSGGAYFDVAQRNLFSEDRSPEVVIAAEAPKPLPPMPVAHGVLDLGAGPTIILSEQSGDGQKGYRVGDSFGDLRIAAITAKDVTFEWDGQRIRRTIDELRPEEDQARAVSTVSIPAAPEPAPPKKAVVVGTVKAGPSTMDMGGGIMACKPGDNSPAGTVVDGHKKVVTPTPFGNVCRWEPVK